MTPTPPVQPPHQAPGGTKKRGWLLPTVIIGAVVLVLCCGGVAVVAVSGGGSGEDPPVAAGGADQTDTGGDRPAGTSEEADDDAAAEDEAAPEPDGFGAGTWEVGTEVPAGTYVTVVPDGGLFDFCYWARLSGFSGSLDDVIANENLSPGARGRVEISSSDTGVEFSGGCTWVEVSQAAPVEIGSEVGAGVWAVGDEVAPGTYTTDADDGDVFDSCYWARLSGFSGELNDVIANGIIEAGSRGRVEISSSDTGVEFVGDCVWSRN
jgi:hypothetical protein